MHHQFHFRSCSAAYIERLKALCDSSEEELNKAELKFNSIYLSNVSV